MPAAFIKQVNPLVIDDWNNDFSLTDEIHYAALINAAKQKDLKVAHTEQLAPGLDLTKEQLAELDHFKISSLQWWEEFFKQCKTRLVSRDVRAEKYGVSMFVIMLNADDI